jgi:hypothetical protein
MKYRHLDFWLIVSLVLILHLSSWIVSVMFGDVPVLGDLDLFEPLGTSSSSSSSNDNFGFSFFFAFFTFTPDVLGLYYQPFLLYTSRRD